MAELTKINTPQYGLGAVENFHYFHYGTRVETIFTVIFLYRVAGDLSVGNGKSTAYITISLNSGDMWKRT